MSQQENAIFQNSLLSVLVLALHTLKTFSKLSRHTFPRQKSDKNGAFDVMTSCSIFDRYIFFKEYFLMSFY